MSVSEKTSVIERLTKPAHLIDMKDIIREGNPTLRAIAEEVSFPLSDQEIILGEKMMQFLKHSQDPVMAEKMGLFIFLLRYQTVIIKILSPFCRILRRRRPWPLSQERLLVNMGKAISACPMRLV